MSQKDNSPKPFQIPIAGKLKEFQQYLDDHVAHRVIFSGPFGSGKTHFLNEFFRGKEGYGDYYRAIHLHPVNYSVASNEDVFELIKFDILFELLEKYQDKLEFDSEAVSSWFKFQWQLQNQSWFNLAQSLIFLARSTGYDENLPVNLESFLQKGRQDIKDIKEQTQKGEEDDFEQAQQFLQTFQYSKGLPTEEDHNTVLIRDLIEQLKDPEKGIDTVLVIDDLDRLDPDHIFRILNVFAAHFDVVKFQTEAEKDPNENKFGFNKVIFSCDLNNIRRIFSNRFGQDVDFSGYIDKFYTKEVFEWDINPQFYGIIDDELKKLKVRTNPSNEDFNLTNKLGIGSSQNNTLGYTLSFLKTLITYNELSIRKLKFCLDKGSIEFQNFNFYFPGSRYRSSTLKEYPINMIQFLESIYGDKETVRKTIKDVASKIRRNPTSYYLKNDKDDQLQILLPFLAQDNNQEYIYDVQQKKGEVNFTLTKQELTIKCEVDLKNPSNTNEVNEIITTQNSVQIKENSPKREQKVHLSKFPLNSFEVLEEIFEIYEGIRQSVISSGSS